MIENIKNRREIVKNRIEELMNVNKNNKKLARFYIDTNKRDEFLELYNEGKLMEEEIEELQEELTMLEVCLVIDRNSNN